MLNNMYEGEALIRGAIDDLFDPELIFTMESIGKLDSRVLAKFPEDKRIAQMVEFRGYDVARQENDHKTARAIIKPTWRVNIVTPSELYNTLAGDILIAIIKRVVALKPDDCGHGFAAIDDVSQYHKPIYDPSLVMHHATFNQRIVL